MYLFGKLKKILISQFTDSYHLIMPYKIKIFKKNCMRYSARLTNILLDYHAVFHAFKIKVKLYRESALTHLRY